VTAWRDEVAGALDDFRAVTELAGAPISKTDLAIEYLDAPHRPPSSLPGGRMAVYGFWHDGDWLKIGQAGPNSQARYTSQHYNPNSAPSTLAASLTKDPRMAATAGFELARPGDWIKARCCRVNVLLPARHGKAVLALLEAFLHVRFQPRYER